MHPADPIRIREIWPPGTVIKGDYAIEKKLGGGGFGTVYLARHKFLGTIHVIKRLHEQYACDEEYVRKFVNEGRAVRRLKGCPYICEVEHMTQSEDGHLILVMEHVAGGDLQGLMETRALRVEEVVSFGRQIALGLDAAHQAGLVHRDIKPQNVMVSHDSTGKMVLKLIDFGIAADHNSSAQTSMMRGGSLGYAAPEQWMRAGKDLDGRTDIYALGATMYRMLCGRMPIETGGDIAPWLFRVSQGPPDPPRSIRADCPAWLSDLIVAMLAYAPEQRPASAAVVARMLEGTPAAAATVLYPSAPSAPVVPTVVEKPSSKTGVWIAAGVAAMALTIGGTWYAMQPKPSPPPETASAPIEQKPAATPPATVPVQKQPEAKKKSDPPASAKPDVKQEAVKPREPEPEPPKPPPVNHAALGDAARQVNNRKDIFLQIPRPGVYLQVSATDRPGAYQFASAYRESGLNADVTPSSSPSLYRVIIGPLPDTDAISDAKAKLRKLGVEGILRRY